MPFSKKTKRRLLNTYGSWALITGASSGIGKALAIKLGEAGFNLLLTARNQTALQDLKSYLETKYPIKTQIIVADCSTKKGVELVISASKHLDIGLLIAAAGFGTSGLFLKSHLKEELNMLEVNCKSLLILSHYFIKQFANRGGGGIILMSSIVGFQGVPNASHYAATKAYVQALAEGLYYELRKVNVAVLAASPGPVNSGFAHRANMQMGKALSPSKIAVPILKALGKKSTVFPGFLTKLLIFGLRTVPRWGKIKIMRLVMGGMTKHQLKMENEIIS